VQVLSGYTEAKTIKYDKDLQVINNMFALSNYLQVRIDDQIRHLDEEIFEKEEQANKLEKCADQLDERARNLRQLAHTQRGNGILWGFFSTAAGLALTPFTGIKTFSI
jgi:hypothetical protein